MYFFLYSKKEKIPGYIFIQWKRKIPMYFFHIIKREIPTYIFHSVNRRNYNVLFPYSKEEKILMHIFYKMKKKKFHCTFSIHWKGNIPTYIFLYNENFLKILTIFFNISLKKSLCIYHFWNLTTCISYSISDIFS